MSLPSELNYDVNLDSIMDGTSTRTHYILPSNGQNFSLGNSGSLVVFDLNSSDYMIPDSLMLTYSYKVKGGGNGNGEICQQKAVPYTSIIDRLEVIMGSQSVQTIPQFNQLSNLTTNLTHSVSNKQGLAISHGYKTYNKFCPTTAHADGAVHKKDATGNVGGPLRCCLSEASHLIPLILMPNVRIQLTLASLQTVFCQGADSTLSGTDTDAKLNNLINGILEQPKSFFPSNFELTDFQLSYDSMSFPSMVTEQLRMSPNPILIKTQGFSTTSQTIPIGTSGVVENVYNSRYASIKNLFLINSSNSTNGIFDSFNISPNASYQFYINGLQYPPLPITKKKNAYIELLKATGSAFDTVANNYAINANEYNYELGDTTTLSEPAKFIIGVSSQVSAFNDRLLSGVSSENSSLSVRMSIDQPTGSVVTSSLVVNFDMILQIDPQTRSASIKM
jgi:hypothetical protein